MRYVAFLRAVNVGGRKVPMARVRSALTGLGLDDVRTYLASGNVFFDTSARSKPALTKKVESALAEEFGFEIPVILRTLAELEKLVASDPFAGDTADDTKRLVVTFSPTGTSCDVIPVVDGRWEMPPDKGKTGTTRFWHTTRKILDAARG